eukprot:m.195740 g.195740  ORF g.195740 m.195740 type:complete len:353 (-) comp53729_c0_seq1:32-1090(-)
MRLNAVYDALASLSPPLALESTPSVDEQTVAGAISTATHGSSLLYGTLSSSVIGLQLVSGLGEIINFQQGGENSDVLCGARVSVGALGVITQVTFRLELAHRLVWKEYPVSNEYFYESFMDIVRDCKFIKFWQYPYVNLTQVYAMRPTTAQANFSTIPSFVYQAQTYVVDFFLWAFSFFPSATPRLNQGIGRFLFVRGTRVNRPDKIQLLPFRVPRHTEMEIAVPLAHAAACIKDLHRITRENNHAHNVNFIFEIRFVKGDEDWLSPSYGGDTCQITVGLHYGQERVDGFFRACEGVMKQYGGRPHWAKRFSLTANTLRPLYPRWNDFQALRQKMDPNGVFVNEFVRRCLIE